MKRLDIIKGVALPVGMLLIMGLIMFVERKGILADVAQSSLDFLPQSVIDRKPAPDTLKKNVWYCWTLQTNILTIIMNNCPTFCNL